MQEEQQTAAFDRIQLNADLEELIDSKGSSERARRAVCDFGLSLTPMGRVAGSMMMESPGDSFTGHTQEQGNVNIQNDQNEVKKMDFGGKPARIGSYKVWREQERKGKFGISIGHFWKLDETTKSETEEAQEWTLTCDTTGPIWFGEKATKVVFNHFGLQLRRRFLVESWGQHVGKCHHAGWAIIVSI